MIVLYEHESFFSHFETSFEALITIVLKML